MNQKIDPNVPEEMRALAWLFNHTLESHRHLDGPSLTFILRHGCGECQGFIYSGRPLEELADLCKKLEQHHAGWKHKDTRKVIWPYDQPFKK